MYKWCFSWEKNDLSNEITLTKLISVVRGIKLLLSFLRDRYLCKSRFPTGVQKVGGGGLFKIWYRVGGLKSIHGRWCMGGLKCRRKIPVQEFCKFTKNELLHTYFWRILARFEVVIYCAFSTNHFMEGCFTFQWRVCFADGGASFLSGGALLLIGGISKKS